MRHGEYVDGAVKIIKAAADGQTDNGSDTEQSGTDLTPDKGPYKHT